MNDGPNFRPTLSLRDYFAGQALPALINMSADFSILAAKIGAPQPTALMKPEQYAETAYEIADAMLKHSTPS